MQAITIGLDIAKNVFQLHGADAEGRTVFQKRLRRGALDRFLAAQPPALIGIEACGSAHHWGRVLVAQGHEVRLIPPAYVKPFVKRNKTDARDAAAICAAVRQPEMRFVAIKSVAQQCDRALHRARDLLIRQRTQLMNALRAMLAEMGIVAPQGVKGFAELMRLVAGRDARVAEALRPSLEALANQWQAADAQARGLEHRIVKLARENEATRRLMDLPGVGPISAHALVAAIGDGRQFRSARDCAAWLGLTPTITASGERRHVGGISRKGDGSVRRLLVLGASARLRHARTRPEQAGVWLSGLLARRPVKVAAVAQAAKTARIAWALLTSGQAYRGAAACDAAA